jgi:hypothetical protein
VDTIVMFCLAGYGLGFAVGGGHSVSGGLQRQKVERLYYWGNPKPSVVS